MSTITASLLPDSCRNWILEAAPPSLTLRSVLPPMKPELLKPRLVEMFALPLLTTKPPFTLRVDAFRVEGIAPPPPPGGYGALFIELMKRLAELMVLVLRAGVMTPPFRVARPATCIVVAAPIVPLNIAPGGSTTRPPTANVCPNTVKELFIVAGFCIVTFPPLTTRPPFVIVCPPFTLIVDAFRVEGVAKNTGGGYAALLMVFTFMLLVLMVLVLIAGDLIVSDAAMIEAPTVAPN